MVVSTKTKTLYSFDIFDTLVTRKTATPKGIFLLMQEILANNNNFSHYFRQNFFFIRVETEDFIRANVLKTQNRNDITFDEIYERIAQNNSLTQEQMNYLKELEIKCEIDNLIPIKENINKVRELFAQGNDVILISDMYHSQDTLRSILIGIDNIFSNIPIYVSSEFSKSKANGDLYKLIKEKLNPENWVHTGDNGYADFSKARQNGIKPNLYKYIQLKEYEKKALNENNLTLEYIIGTAKNLRLNSNNEKYNFGCSFASPILYSYVSWIIESSLSSGVEHLYFVARDGYIPKLIADEIIKIKNLNIKTHYFYGSRKAWRIPTKNTVDTFISHIFDEYLEQLCGKFIAKRLGISRDEFEKYTNLECNNKKYNKKQRTELFNKLINNNDFKEFLIQKHSQYADLIIKYFEQEIDISKNNFAFVDLNGSGRSQDILADIISEKNNIPITSYYFCSELNVTSKPNSIKKIFICTQKYRHYWVELLSRNPDGQTLGYYSENNTIKPKLERVNPEKLLTWGYSEYIQGILNFASEYTKIPCSLVNIEFYKQYFDHIVNCIDNETANILGSIPYADIGNEKYIHECAPKLNLFQAFSLMYKKNKKLYFISKGRSSSIVKKFIDIMLEYKSLRKFLINIHIRKKKNEAYICIFGIKLDIRIFLKGYNE